MITFLLIHSGSLTSMVIIFHCTLFIHCNVFWYIMTNYYCTYVYVIFCMYVEIAFHTVFRTLHYFSLAVNMNFKCPSPKNVVVKHYCTTVWINPLRWVVSALVYVFPFVCRYLLNNQQQQQHKSVIDLMPMIGARFYMQLDAIQIRADMLENEVSKEMENGRLCRLLVKLGTINERPEWVCSCVGCMN